MTGAADEAIDLGSLDDPLARVTNPIGGTVVGGVPTDGLDDWAFRGARWQGVTGTTANLSSLDFASGHVLDGRLPGSDWSSASLAEVVIADTDLGGAGYADASLRRVVFDACKLARAHFFGATLIRVRFERCQMRYSEFNGCRVEDVTFRDCDLTGSLFTHLTLPPGSRLDLRGSVIAETSGLAEVGSLVVDDDQAAQIAAAYLRERGVEIGADTQHVRIRSDVASRDLRRHITELTAIDPQS